MNTTRQQDLFTDLPRGEQLQLLRRVKLDSWKVGKTAVSGAIQKAVLRVIDDRDGGHGCFAAQETIASEVGCSRASVGRAIAALIDRDMITKERPNHWSPNHHRVNWTALRQADASTAKIDASTTQGEASTAHHDASDSYVCNIGELGSSGPLLQDELRNAPLNANLIATTNRPEEWQAVVEEMFLWGLKTAGQAVDAARSRGWSIEYVRELFLEAGGDREPKRWEPGQLSNWLTGKTPPPFDETEVHRRDDDRQRIQQDEADRIRQGVTSAGVARAIPTDVIRGTVARRLREKGLERFSEPEELQSAIRMDKIDRQRDAKQAEPENRAPTIDAPDTGRHGSTSEPSYPANATGVSFRRVPGTGIGLRRREIERALLAIDSHTELREVVL